MWFANMQYSVQYLMGMYLMVYKYYVLCHELWHTWAEGQVVLNAFLAHILELKIKQTYSNNGQLGEANYSSL